MSTILNTNGSLLDIPGLCSVAKGKFYVITAEWNSDITHALRDGAIDTIRKAGAGEKNIISVKVPGTVELINVAAQALKKGDAEAVIIIGCVIRGDTPHFDYVCSIAAQGTALLNVKGEAPVIFGVLTVENMQQALDRAGGRLGNKGSEAGAAAVELVNLHYKMI